MVNFPNCYVQVLHKSVFIAITKKTIQLLLLIFNSVICKTTKTNAKTTNGQKILQEIVENVVCKMRHGFETKSE